MADRNQSVHIRMPPSLRANLQTVALERGLTVTELCYQILTDWEPNSDRYFERQLGAQVILSVAMSYAVARKTLSDRELVEARDLAGKISGQLFGPIPPRPFTEDLTHPSDPRIEALHKAMLDR